jgi:hypothetical protein
MSRLNPISYGAGVLLVPDWCNPTPPRDERIVRPARKKGELRARV